MESVFRSSLPPWKTYETTVRRKTDAIFQTVHDLVNVSLQKTPLHVALSQAVPDTSKSKRLITIANRLGLCSSYHYLARIDTGLAKHIIALAGPSRVSVPLSILPGSLINGAMDNFDHEEHKLSDIGGSHDIILMLSQNNGNPSEDHEVATFSTKTVFEQTGNCRSLEDIMDCERLKFTNRHSVRATIPSSCTPTLPIDWSNTIGTSDELYRFWVLFRHSKDPDRIQNIPSCAATNNTLLRGEGNQATMRVAFTPIIPHLATDRSTINTAMVNFQDVLGQKGLGYGLLWCDKRVHRIAKELQLQNPVQFENIFLGIGGFHLEKNLFACCGVYLEGNGFKNILLKNEIFAPVSVKSVVEIISKESIQCEFLQKLCSVFSSKGFMSH